MSWQHSRKKWRKYRSKGEMKVILETAKIKSDVAKKKPWAWNKGLRKVIKMNENITNSFLNFKRIKKKMTYVENKGDLSDVWLLFLNKTID